MSIIAVDTGGTFTDIVYVRAGALHILKVPSTPADPARAVIDAVNAVLPQSPGLPIPPTLVHGSTVATNALLERKGARVALITNAGFEDVIEIGRQNRPQLYALVGTRPAPLVERELRLGIRGRMDHSGAEIEALDEQGIVALRERLEHADSIAVCLLHSYANDAHERRVGQLLEGSGKHVSLSCDVLPEYREYERTATTVVNAYVAPLMHSYLERLESETRVSRVRVMGSAGGAVPVAVARREPVHTVLSGPAGGVAGALTTARAAGMSNIIAFDMGGTSTDVSVCPGAPLQTREFSIAGVPVAVPVLDIHTVGAGGGSIAWIDAGGVLRVGPHSAGAVPGPICYGRGGQLVTVTDANVWLGRLPVHALLGGTMRLERAPIEQPLAQLGTQLGMTAEQVAEGIITIANSTMEGALRVISVERGYDPIDFTLVAFGGAAGLHAADLADRLGLPRILLPPHPGVLSAYGMLASPVRKSAARTVILRSDAGIDSAIATAFAQLEENARTAMMEEGIPAAEIAYARTIDARYHGQSHELSVAAEDWVGAFHQAHARRYGYDDRGAVVEAVTLRVETSSPDPVLPAFQLDETSGPEPSADHRAFAGGDWHTVRVFPRASISATAILGPAVVTEYSGTTWVPAGWQLRRLASGALLLERH